MCKQFACSDNEYKQLKTKVAKNDKYLMESPKSRKSRYIDVSLGCSLSAQTCWYDFNWENLDVINTSLGFSNPLAAAKTLMQSRQKAKKFPANNSECKNANLSKYKIYLFPELSQKSCAKLFTFQILWKLVWLIKWPKEILWLRKLIVINFGSLTFLGLSWFSLTSICLISVLGFRIYDSQSPFPYPPPLPPCMKQ